MDQEASCWVTSAGRDKSNSTFSTKRCTFRQIWPNCKKKNAYNSEKKEQYVERQSEEGKNKMNLQQTAVMLCRKKKRQALATASYSRSH